MEYEPNKPELNQPIIKLNYLNIWGFNFDTQYSDDLSPPNKILYKS